MGNGYPVAGLVARRDLIADFGQNARYFNTFGGNSVACAALAVLDVLEAEGLAQNCRLQGEALRNGLRALATRSPILHDIHGEGLMIGVKLMREGRPATSETTELVNQMRERGVLISAASPHHNTLKTRQPLIVSPRDIDQILSTMEQVLAKLQTRNALFS